MTAPPLPSFEPPSYRLPVHVLGATGSVGQRFVSLLADHPWFEVAGLSASERSAGRPYAEAVRWSLPTPIPPTVAALQIAGMEQEPRAELVFSALDATTARQHERRLAQAGHVVVTNASAHRLDPDVPLLVPEVNPDHTALLAAQGFDGGGALLANPNCTTIGLVLALRPLVDAFGLEALVLTSLQATSGAGLDGPGFYGMNDNVLPFIGGEEEKLAQEVPKLLGTVTDGRVEPFDVAVSATCTRVPVVDGHTLSVSARFGRRVSPEEVADTLRAFRAAPQELALPSAPARPVHVLDDESAPQPRLHRDVDGGMATVVGRIRPCPVLDTRFVLLSHNTLRGAAGGALLVAELALATGAIRSER